MMRRRKRRRDTRLENLYLRRRGFSHPRDGKIQRQRGIALWVCHRRDWISIHSQGWRLIVRMRMNAKTYSLVFGAGAWL